MAKIIAAEKIKLDTVEVSKNTEGKLVFGSEVQAGVDVTDSLQTRLSKQESDQDSVSGSIESRLGDQETDQNSVATSLQTRLSKQESDQDSVSGSIESRLGDQETDQNSVATSLQTRLSKQESDQDSVSGSIESRLSDQESDQDSVTGSIHDVITNIDDSIRVSNYAIVSGAERLTCNYSGFNLPRSPKVMGMIKNADATQPIMVCQLKRVTRDKAIFDFSENAPSGDYSMDIILTVEPQGHTS